MEIISITDERFKAYGQVLQGYDWTELLDKLDSCPRPEAGTVYAPGSEVLESCKVYEDLRDRSFGGMPIQIGYCNGVNSTLNCLEYHKSSEVNVARNDVILMLGLQSEIVDDKFDTKNVKAFLVPAGTAVELYATSLHYAPCGAKAGDPFRVSVVLPKGTNEAKPAKVQAGNQEDAMLWCQNKWLLAHPDSPEAGKGAYVGLTGENIVLK